jgi:hypothetical protein
MQRDEVGFSGQVRLVAHSCEEPTMSLSPVISGTCVAEDAAYIAWGRATECMPMYRIVAYTLVYVAMWLL